MTEAVVGPMAEKLGQFTRCGQNQETDGSCRTHSGSSSPGASCVDGVASAGGTNYDCSGVDLLSFTSFADMGLDDGYLITDSWGWTDPSTADEIVIICGMDDVAFVQITDPSAPIVLGTLQQTGSQIREWCDNKVHALRLRRRLCIDKRRPRVCALLVFVAW